MFRPNYKFSYDEIRIIVLALHTQYMNGGKPRPDSQI